MRKAFRGPNGWYVADEDDSGTHYQPFDGGRYHTKQQRWRRKIRHREHGWTSMARSSTAKPAVLSGSQSEWQLTKKQEMPVMLVRE
jgi:hypothetical protein